MSNYQNTEAVTLDEDENYGEVGSFLCERKDILDNAAYDLMRQMLDLQAEGEDCVAFPWDMELIGELEDFITEMLAERGLTVCHPYYEDGENTRTPCYLGQDCKKPTCPFK